MCLPVHFVIALVAGWLQREQGAVLEYLREENKALLEHLGEKRLRFTDAQRRRLARRGTAQDYDDSYEVRVFRGTTESKLATQVATRVVANDGWLTLDVDLKSLATNTVWVEAIH